MSSPSREPSGPASSLTAVIERLATCGAPIDVPLDVLDHDDRVVHQHAETDDHPGDSHLMQYTAADRVNCERG